MHASPVLDVARNSLATEATHDVSVPIDLGNADGKWDYVEVPMYDPHEILSYLWQSAGVYVDPEDVKHYWDEAENANIPWAVNAQGPNHKERIPLKIFGDEATYNKLGDQCLGIVLSCPLWCPKVSRPSRWTIAVLKESRSAGFPTWLPLLSRIVWSLNLAYDGVGGCRFQVTEVGGDWKYLRQVFQLRSHWNTWTNFCHMCKLPRMDFPTLPDHLPFRNLREFIEDVLPANGAQSPIVLLKGFDLSCVQWCQLHVLNLGLLWTANGGTLDLLMTQNYFGHEGQAMAFKLESAFEAFCRWLKDAHLQSSQKKFTVRMLYKKTHGAYLTTKGWNSRLITAWLADACSDALGKLPPNDESVLTSHAMWLDLNLDCGSQYPDNSTFCHVYSLLRISIARYLALSERSPRYLKLV